MNNQAFAVEFLSQSVFRIEENLQKIVTALATLSEEEVWKRPNAASNSVGNQLLHLCGNVTQYIISALGEREDLRERDAEFSAKGGISKKALEEKLQDTVQQAVHVIRSCPTERLLARHSVQGFELTAIGIIIHVVEHFSYHTGQILFWTKQLRNTGFDFYKDLDLNAKNG